MEHLRIRKMAFFAKGEQRLLDIATFIDGKFCHIGTQISRIGYFDFSDNKSTHLVKP